MDAIDLLKGQHKQVKALFDRIEQADDEDEKAQTFEELANNLAAHTTIEEEIFYPAAYADQTEDLLLEAVEEHLSMKRIIVDLLQLSADEDEFDAKLKVLQEQFEHHVEEEESELFKRARTNMSSDELSTLGEDMLELFEEEMSGEPSEKVFEQTDEAARLR